MIDRSWIGHVFEPLEVDVELGRLRQFAKAIGETRPEYSSDTAARAKGWPNVPVPPTLLFGLEMEQPNPWAYLETIGVDIAQVLHAEQHFEYHVPAWAGDRLTFEFSIADIYDKRQGALEFVTKATTVVNQRSQLVAKLRKIIVVRNEVSG
jgi:acyl dehydratase